MANKEKLLVWEKSIKSWQKWREGKFHVLGALYLIINILLSGCTMSYATVVPSAPVEVEASPTLIAVASVTPLPTWTPLPAPTSVPFDPPGTIGMDFIALLCNADWMNGAVHLTPCPGASADQSGGYATIYKVVPKEFPADTPILLMVPNANALFLRYPSYKVGANDRFRTVLLCGTSASCDVEFALEYYDAKGKYHEFMKWDYKTGEAPIEVDADLSALAGQSVDFSLTLRLFHEIESPQHDNGLWVAPHIYRPVP